MTAQELGTETAAERAKPPAAKEAPAAPLLICACLAWYDEPPESLDRCVRSLAGVADILVALDGRWDEMPAGGDGDLSSKAEIDAIKNAAADVGLELVMSAKGAPFESQVAKRNELMRLATKTGASWLFVIDGDESIECPHPEQARAVLGGLDGDVCHVMCHVEGRGVKQPDRGIRRIYRAACGVTLEHAHNGYRAKDGRWLHGDPLYAELTPPALELEPLLKINHHVDARDRGRQHQAMEYRMARRRLGLERWPR